MDTPSLCVLLRHSVVYSSARLPLPGPWSKAVVALWQQVVTSKLGLTREGGFSLAKPHTLACSCWGILFWAHGALWFSVSSLIFSLQQEFRELGKLAVWNMMEKEVQAPDNQTNEVRWCQYSSTPRKTFIRRVSRKDGRQAVGTEGPLGCRLTGISPLVVS